MRGGGMEKGEVLMGNRRMACQCQKWSCAEERLGENEREDGRRAWLINLFTSMKMLRAPLWLKFSLPSIIAMAGLNLQSCRYQTLSKRSSLQPAPPPHSSSNKPIALSQQHNLHLILVTSSLVSKPSVILLSVTLSSSPAEFVCVSAFLSTPSSVLLSFFLWRLPGNGPCVS